MWLTALFSSRVNGYGFQVLESYAIKWFMRLTGMQLAEVICIKHFFNKTDCD